MSRESRSSVIVGGTTYVAVENSPAESCDGCDLTGRLCHYVDGCTEEYRVDGLNVIWKAQKPSSEEVTTTEIRPASRNNNQKWGSW